MKDFIETRYLVGAVTLAEELNFTRAAKRLGLSQSALSRQMQELEDRIKQMLFIRNNARVTLTDAGRAFVEEAKLSLLHDERAVQFARAAGAGVESTLTIGRSPYTDPLLTTTLLSIHLPLYPNLRINLHSDFQPELVHGLLVAQLDLALIASPGSNRKLTTTKVTETSFCVALPRRHPLLAKSAVSIRDLADTTWILFERKVHPVMHDTILRRGAEEGIAIKDSQTFLAVEEACQLVTEGVGIAFMTIASARRIVNPDVGLLPIVDPELNVDVCLASRAENRSKLVSEFARAFMKRVTQVLHPPQMMLPMN